MPSDSSATENQTVAIVGGGISGLAAAYYLGQANSNVEVALFESGAEVGGVLGTNKVDGYLIEQSADMFTTNEPDAISLCEEIGFADQLIETNQENRRAFVCVGNQLHPVPTGFVLMSPTKMESIWKSPLLSFTGKMRLAYERFVSRRTDPADESLQDFAERRFGKQAFQRLIQPLIGGIYTADPARLSMQATMNQFVQAEREHGSLILAAKKQLVQQEQNSSGVRYGKFLAPREGMSQFVNALAEQIPQQAIRLNQTVQRLTKGTADGGKWEVKTSESALETFDALIVATPAHVAATLMESTEHTLASQLLEISYASTAVVVQAYRRDQIKHPLCGFGFVVPQVARRKILACSFSSIKFAGRAPDGSVLVRTFVGGALQPELLDQADDEMIKLVTGELAELLSISDGPIFSQVQRWNRAMPQYHVGHLDRIAAIRESEHKISNFALAGNALQGVGIPACIRSGRDAARKVAAQLDHCDQ